jgi:hypothetical protein
MTGYLVFRRWVLLPEKVGKMGNSHQWTGANFPQIPRHLIANQRSFRRIRSCRIGSTTLGHRSSLLIATSPGQFSQSLVRFWDVASGSPGVMRGNIRVSSLCWQGVQAIENRL